MANTNLLTETEQQFVDRQQAKANGRLLRELKAVNTHRAVSRSVNETLSANGLIEFGGPSETCKYNHYRLTAAGKSELDRLILLSHIFPMEVGQ